MGVFSRFFHSRDKPDDPRRAQDTLGGSRFSFFFGSSTSGKPVNERTAMQMTAVCSPRAKSRSILSALTWRGCCGAIMPAG